MNRKQKKNIFQFNHLKLVYSETPLNYTPSASKCPLYRTWPVVPKCTYFYIKNIKSESPFNNTVCLVQMESGLEGILLYILITETLRTDL